MNGKTHTIRRGLSVLALGAALAAIAIPAASAQGKQEGTRVLGPGLGTLEKQGPYGAYWIRKQVVARVLGPGLGTIEKRGPYGAYWVLKAAQVKPAFTPSVVDRLVGSPDPRDSAALGLDEPSLNEVHLYPGETADVISRGDDVSSQVFRNAGQEHGSNGFVGQTRDRDHVSVTLPRADDPMFREIVQEAAQEHGATGFGNGLDLSSLSWKPITVDYAHLPQEDRP